MKLVFPSEDALCFVLTGGVVRPDISLSAVRCGRDDADRPWIIPARELPSDVRAKLARIGVVEQPDTGGGTVVDSWPQAVPLRRDVRSPEITSQSTVLFELPDSLLPELVGEMLRLGNDRQSYRPLTEGTSLLRVHGPPYYSLLRATDGDRSGPVAYVEQAPRVFVEFGYTHPLVGHLKPAAGQALILRSPHDWRAVEDGQYLDIYDVLEFELPATAVGVQKSGPHKKLRVPLRLAPASSTDPAELWVLDEPAVLDAFVRDAGDELIARLAFAVVTQPGRTRVIVRSRPGKGNPPVLVLPATAYRTYLRLSNLFVPVSARIHPPLRRDAIRRVLADDPMTVTWLEPAGGAAFIPYCLPESSFLPLEQWVDYVLDHERESLSAWVGGFRFEFDSYVCAEDRPAKDKPPPAGPRKPRQPKPQPEPETPPTAPKLRPTKPAPPEPPPVLRSADDAELRARLREVEREFLDDDGPLDSPKRRKLWPILAELSRQLRQNDGASLCWLNAAWEEDPPPPELLSSWADSRRATPSPDDLLSISRSRSDPDGVHALAAGLAVADVSSARWGEVLPEIIGFLERHEGILPVRAAWLAWSAVARLGGDVLTLARARDRLLEQLLNHGLHADRDLPPFLRFSDSPTGNRLREMSGWVEKLHQAVREWWHRDGPAVGPHDATPAYIDLTFAFGLAKTGNGESARGLLAKASEALGGFESETHSFLLQAYVHRIEQALRSIPHAGPLPVNLLEYLEHLRGDVGQGMQQHVQSGSPAMANSLRAKFNDVYLIDRYREQSRVIDPQEKFDPYQAIDRSFSTTVSRTLAGLADRTDQRVLSQEVRKLWKELSGHPPAERAKSLGVLLPLAVRTGRPLSGEFLEFVPPVARAALEPITGQPAYKEGINLLQRGMVFAAHLERPDLAKQFTELFLEQFGGELRRPLLEAAGPFLAEGHRGLRKLGLVDESNQFLGKVTDRVVRGSDAEAMRQRDPAAWPHLLRVLLHLSGGWLYLGNPKPAQEWFAEARDFLFRRENRQPNQWVEYVGVASAYAAAVGQAPFAEAAGRIEELFTANRLDPLPNTFTSRSHYSRLHLNIVEAVVLAVTSDDFAIGATARRWLDDDEYLVRRRIHRDTRRWLGEHGW